MNKSKKEKFLFLVKIYRLNVMIKKQEENMKKTIKINQGHYRPATTEQRDIFNGCLKKVIDIQIQITALREKYKLVDNSNDNK